MFHSLSPAAQYSTPVIVYSPAHDFSRPAGAQFTDCLTCLTPHTSHSSLNSPPVCPQLFSIASLVLLVSTHTRSTYSHPSVSQFFPICSAEHPCLWLFPHIVPVTRPAHNPLIASLASPHKYLVPV